MKNLNKASIEKAKQAKSAEELLTVDCECGAGEIMRSLCPWEEGIKKA